MTFNSRPLAGLACLMICWATTLHANNNVLTKDQGYEAVSATIDDVAWLTGHWRGESEWGWNEHILPPPLYNQMVSVVRFYDRDPDEIRGNEIALFVERNGSVDYVVRHFHSGLIAVEPVDEPIVRQLLKKTDNALYFEDITFVRLNDKQHKVYFQYTDDKGEKQILEIIQHKINSEHK